MIKFSDVRDKIISKFNELLIEDICGEAGPFILLESFYFLPCADGIRNGKLSVSLDSGQPLICLYNERTLRLHFFPYTKFLDNVFDDDLKKKG